MHINPHDFQDTVPALLARLAPPDVHGMAELAHRAYAGCTFVELLDFVGRSVTTDTEDAALMFDQGLAHRLYFKLPAAEALQALALAQCRIFRVKPRPGHVATNPLRVLAVVTPGDLMTNTPLEFITRYLDVRLDLLFVRPGQAFPCCVPDHDVAFFGVSEADPGMLQRLKPLFDRWPRPVLNDPAAIGRLSRDMVARGLAGRPGICSPETRRLPRAGVDKLRIDEPLLIRPVGTHAGEGLDLIGGAGDLAAFLGKTEALDFFVTEFVDYRGVDGLFRKYRIAFVDGAPFLCHMAVSKHWMVHYLNAEMAQNEERRAEEALAMADFDSGFAKRHATAFDAMSEWMGLDYYQIDCAETPDGRLLVFEADVAAIVHLMDPPDLFPYKPAQMRRVFAAFGDMLERTKARHYETSLAKVEAMG